MKLKSKFIKLSPHQRLYHLDIPVIGLTGGIATGKSTVAKYLAQKNIPVINADHLVKDIYRMKEVQHYIETHHPEVVHQGEIQFPQLREKVFKNKDVKVEIEKLIYSHLPEAFKQAYSKFLHPQVVVYDVPLLFEKNMSSLFDLNVLVYAPRRIQRDRLMMRDNHHEAMADTILDQQMSIEDKKTKADLIIDNSGTEEELTAGIQLFLQQVFETI